MDKTAIKNFAIWARNALIRSTMDKCGLVGIREEGIQNPLPQSTAEIQFFDAGTGTPSSITGMQISQRDALVQKIREKERDSNYLTAYNYVVEQVAYTWFNRLIAIRFMEVNDYLPSRIRVLSSEQAGKLEPDIVTTPFDADFVFRSEEEEQIHTLKDRGQREDMDALFRILFVKQCDALHEILPNLFQKVDSHDYTELLLNISFTDQDGVVYHLVNDIPEDNFNFEQNGQVESIGWAYQYYNEERKNEVINIYKGTVKKEDIPAATQLFTTDWVVRYMVDNSLGRYWIERHPESTLSEKLAFLVTPKDGIIAQVSETVAPEELKVFDPCMGSGHILVYAFDVLMEIYKECGYTERDAAALIVKNNLFGLDIDDRASQLAYFAVMMKARSYDRRFLSRGISPNVLAIKESNLMGSIVCDGVAENPKMNEISQYLVDVFRDAKELGSIIRVDSKDYDSYIAYLDSCDEEGQLDWNTSEWLNKTRPMLNALAKQAKILSGQYPIVCTNPPYLNKMESELKTVVTRDYKDYSGDLFSVFIYRNLMFCAQDGYCGYMTPFVWMFIKTYEKLREFIIQNKSITTLVQMEYSAFEEATVPICSFVLKNGRTEDKGLYFKLSGFKGGMEIQKQKVLEALENKKCGYFYEAQQSNFSKIPGSPVAYWVSQALLEDFSRGDVLKAKGDTRQGMATSDNNRFLRLWHEVKFNKIGLGCNNADEAKETQKKWFPYNKGGEFRKWYGNIDYTVNYENDGYEVKQYAASLYKTPSRTIKSMSEYFKPCLSWSKISSGSIAFRYYPEGFVFDVAGCCIFYKDKEVMLYDFGFVNSVIAKEILSAISPTLNYEAGHIASLPVIRENIRFEKITGLVQNNIGLSKQDWDSYETSWDFKRHPLV